MPARSTNKAKVTRAVALLLQGYKPPEIAKELGVHERTVWRWLSDPAVRAEIDRQRAEIAEEARRILAGAATKAARTLVDLLDCKRDRVRLDAAIALIDRLRVLESTDEQTAAIQELVATLREMRCELVTEAIESETAEFDTPGDA